MGRLHEVVNEIDQVIKLKGLDPSKTKGEISLKAGFFIALVFPNTPDDPDKATMLEQAAKEVLGVPLSV